MAFLKGRLWGLLLFGLGLYLLSQERMTIARTGHGGSKSAVVPLIVLGGLALAVDPENRRPGTAGALYLLGAAGSVVWFFVWG